jgi:hypothetical protein
MIDLKATTPKSPTKLGDLRSKKKNFSTALRNSFFLLIQIGVAYLFLKNSSK